MRRQHTDPSPGRQGASRASGGWFDNITVHSRWLVLSRPKVSIPALPKAWDALRIAHLTDLHVGRLCGVGFIRRVVAVANAQAPDMVVLTGDLVSRRAAITDALADALGELRAPAGRFAVLGNHDHACGPGQVTALLRHAGFDVLIDEHRLLDRGGQKLCLAGVDDYRAAPGDLAKTLAGVEPDVPRIVLTHNPDYAPTMPSAPRVDLMLCGHTHGGQMKLPFGPAPWLSLHHRRYAEGLIRGPRCPVYVSRGIGMAYVPLRFNCRPELPVLTLRRADRPLDTTSPEPVSSRHHAAGAAAEPS